MEAAVLGHGRVNSHLICVASPKFSGERKKVVHRWNHRSFSKSVISLNKSNVGLGRNWVTLNKWHIRSKVEWKFRVCCSGSDGQVQSLMSPVTGTVPSLLDNEGDIPDFQDPSSFKAVPAKSKAYKNRFLNFVRLSSVINNAAEAFFKSEIRRRLFVTAALLVLSRVGYFIPLPGFDRRMIPQDFLKVVSGSVEELGDLTTDLKLSFFQLGISPLIMASICMQVLCHLVPSFVKLRKEGLNGHEKIKSYIWWISLCFAIVEALVISSYSLPYSVHAASNRVKHVIITSFLMVCGAMTVTWISDTITESGFGQGTSLIVCVGILTGYTDTLSKMLSKLLGSVFKWWPYATGLLGIFTLFTMGAVIVTEGCRKIKLQYYGFKLASSARNDSPVTEVEPYIPFNINPSGMQPILTTTYLLAFPSIVARL